MRNVTLAALALTAAMSTQARANYSWEFDVTKAVAGYYNFTPPPPFGFIPDPSISNKEAKSWLPGFEITITDHAFASRTLTTDWSGCNSGAGCQNPPSGDISSIVSFTGAEVPSPYGSGHIDLSYTKRGKLTGDIELEGEETDLNLQSDGRLWTGWYASDNSECGFGGAQRCDLTGHWKFLGHSSDSSVPEPASLGLLAMGLVGAGAARWWRFG